MALRARDGPVSGTGSHHQCATAALELEANLIICSTITGIAQQNEAKSTVGKDNIHLNAPRGPEDQVVKIPSRLRFQIGELEGKRFLVLMHHSPWSVKVAVERHDYDGFALPAAIHGSQSTRLPEDLADDADDEDAIPSIIDPLASSGLFFHEGFELPEVDGIAEPEQERSGLRRTGRIGRVRERRVKRVRAMHLAHILWDISHLSTGVLRSATNHNRNLFAGSMSLREKASWH
ncbi:uncharacterized protein F5891DRAFT_987948 [Suillus fuscotomentosus]|uniref:Uncharacterized protein n=1 Tax=Suillus fuscotomentosus TaxID=1912939 RepID=A0AAD4HBH6_9AGAM|nr:uncharacterized protein F5891DRAFT_987948 [Suillus fuscotomentosus]KAG1887995.1 hypothetical protein F5891DRAFT_987948 [Suillus fuscotomentosus]